MRLSHLWCERYWKVCWSGACLASNPFYALLLSSLLKEGQLCRPLFVGFSDSQFPLSLGSPMGNTKGNLRKGKARAFLSSLRLLLVLPVEAVSFVASMTVGLACHNSSIHCVTLALGSCSGIFFCLSSLGMVLPVVANVQLFVLLMTSIFYALCNQLSILCLLYFHSLWFLFS